jgi:hypothetical protein
LRRAMTSAEQSSRWAKNIAGTQIAGGVQAAWVQHTGRSSCLTAAVSFMWQVYVNSAVNAPACAAPPQHGTAVTASVLQVSAAGSSPVTQYAAVCVNCVLQTLYVSILKYAAVKCAVGFAQK